MKLEWEEEVLDSIEVDDAAEPAADLGADENAPQGTGPQCENQEALDIRTLDFYKRIFRLDGAEYALGGLLAATVEARTQNMMFFQRQEEAKAKRDGDDGRHGREHVLTGAMSVAHASASVQLALVRMHALSIKHYMSAIVLLPCPGAYDGFVEQYCKAGRLGPPIMRHRMTADLALQFEDATNILDLCNGHWGIAMLAPFSYGDGPPDTGPAVEATALNGDQDVTRLFAEYYKRKKPTLDAICLLGKAILDAVIAGGGIPDVLESTRRKLVGNQDLSREEFSKLLRPWFGRDCGCKPYID